MAAVVGIISGRDLSIHTHRENRVSYIALYKPLLHCSSYLKQLYLSNKTECFSFKDRRGWCGCTLIELAWAADKWLRVINTIMLVIVLRS